MSQSSPAVFSLHYVGLNLKKGVTEETFEAFVPGQRRADPGLSGLALDLAEERCAASVRTNI